MLNKKPLIAYYSLSGKTKDIAQKIQKLTGGVLFEIKTLSAYPVDYDEVVKKAQIEKEHNVKPELLDNGDISFYDTIFIGTPVWWYTFASPIRTFLTEHDFTGKTIIPFCTHGGGGEASVFDEIKELCISAKVKQGFVSYENTAKIPEIESWLKRVNV